MGIGWELAMAERELGCVDGPWRCGGAGDSMETAGEMVAAMEEDSACARGTTTIVEGDDEGD